MELEGRGDGGGLRKYRAATQFQVEIEKGRSMKRIHSSFPKGNIGNVFIRQGLARLLEWEEKKDRIAEAIGVRSSICRGPRGPEGKRGSGPRWTGGVGAVKFWKVTIGPKGPERRHRPRKKEKVGRQAMRATRRSPRPAFTVAPKEEGGGVRRSRGRDPIANRAPVAHTGDGLART